MSLAAPRALRVGLLGCGVVGSEVARRLVENTDELAERVGTRLELAGIAVRRTGRTRPQALDPGLFTTDAPGLVKRSDVVIEVIGGIEPARGLILAALKGGASVVTANKTLLAEDAGTLVDAATTAGCDLYFEAAVAAAVPILRPLRESLAGDRVLRVTGIVNGTTNFILDKMSTEGTGFATALQEAQAHGYAEADPTADVEGHDAAAKAAILASLAFHTRVVAGDVHREGIREVSTAVITSAAQIGHVVKLLAVCERHDDVDPAAVSARVHPAMIPAGHPLASVRGAYNAVFVEAEAAGRLMFYGPGAGAAPTASAVLGDLVTVARHRLHGAGSRGSGHNDGRGDPAPPRLAILPIGAIVTRYHIALAVADRAGVLAVVAQEFARHDVSIETVRQEGRGTDAQLVVVTHRATDAALAATVAGLRRIDVVREVSSVVRVEAEDA